MPRVLIAELKQETATFNPVPTRYDDFQVHRGDAIFSTYAKTKTELAGAIDSLHAAGGMEIVPTLAAAAVSGGPIERHGLDRLLGELIEMVRQARDIDAAYICLHGAMAGEDDDDPEGRLLSAIRELLPGKPIVASLDLHAVLTDRMLVATDVLVPFQTYPHVDQYETGQRAIRNLLRLIQRSVRPTTARVSLPMLVRGDELITATGLFGQAIHMCQQIEQSPGGLSAGVIIGNAFTDVPALRSNVIVTTDDDLSRAQSEAKRIAEFMWQHREQFQARLTPLDAAIRMAEETDGLTVLSDGADATASGAPGDSNAIFKGLLVRNFSGTALVPIVDAPAVRKAFTAGIGRSCAMPLGGTRDPDRFEPVIVEAYVQSLHDGTFCYEDSTTGRAGCAAVLVVGRIHILVTERPVYVVGRRVFQAHGLEPRDFDLVVVKSPNGYRTWYQEIAAQMIPVDVPGSTSAQLTVASLSQVHATDIPPGRYPFVVPSSGARMKITAVEPIHLRVPVVDAIPDGTLDVLVVKIHTDEGLTGIGEVTSQSYVCKACFEAPRSAARRHGLTSILLGEDPRDIERLWQKMYYETNRYGRRGAAIHALSGADIALWDLKGKAEGKPVYELLGGAHRTTVRAYASVLFGDTPEQTSQLARDFVALGLTAAKFGWGPFGKEPGHDLEQVTAAREALGPERDLMVDAGHAWEWPTALERARLLAPLQIRWLEEPLSQDDRAGYAQLCPQSPVPIAAGEGDVTHWDFEDLLERGLHVVQPDVAFCGGLTVCRQVSQMAEARGRRVVPHCFSTGINLAASLHWMASVPSGDLVEYCLRPSPLMRKLVKNLPPLVQGHVAVPSGPGLGIELDEGIVNEFRVGS